MSGIPVKNNGKKPQVFHKEAEKQICMKLHKYKWKKILVSWKPSELVDENKQSLHLYRTNKSKKKLALSC